MMRVKVDSSMFLALSYNHRNQLLELECRDGSILHCFEIPQVLFEQMVTAPSKGKFYHRWIRDIFEIHVYRDVGGRFWKRSA